MPYPGEPKDTPIPARLDRWNWGAFFLNWIWGIGNSTFIALLMFIPLVNIIMIFVLGAKGSKWAWKNRVWEDEAHFIKTQRNWARAGLIVLLAFLALIYGVMTMMKNNDAFRMSMAKISSNERVIAEFGEPIEAGWFVMGNISINGSSGEADLSIPISGPKCEGRVTSRASKVAGEWNIHLLIVQSECSAEPIILINENNLQIPGANSSRDI